MTPQNPTMRVALSALDGGYLQDYSLVQGKVEQACLGYGSGVHAPGRDRPCAATLSGYITNSPLVPTGYRGGRPAACL